MQLDRQLGAPGDFAQAYVIAHEVGHHIQNLQGTTDKLDQLRRQVSKEEYNELSVRLELQADFYAVSVCTMPSAPKISLSPAMSKKRLMRLRRSATTRYRNAPVAASSLSHSLTVPASND